MDALLTQPVRFLIVGGIFALIYACTTAALTVWFGFSALLTSIFVYLACIPLAYHTHRFFTFKDHVPRERGMFAYAGAQLLSLCVVSFIATYFVVSDFWIDSGIYLIAAGVMAAVSYTITKHLSFYS